MGNNLIPPNHWPSCRLKHQVSQISQSNHIDTPKPLAVVPFEAPGQSNLPVKYPSQTYLSNHIDTLEPLAVVSVEVPGQSNLPVKSYRPSQSNLSSNQPMSSCHAVMPLDTPGLNQNTTPTPPPELQRRRSSFFAIISGGLFGGQSNLPVKSYPPSQIY